MIDRVAVIADGHGRVGGVRAPRTGLIAAAPGPAAVRTAAPTAVAPPFVSPWTCETP